MTGTLNRDLNPIILYLTFLVVGTVTLLPFNAIINASFYYSVLYASSVLEDLYESYFSMAFTLMQVIGLTWQLYVVKYYVSCSLIK